MKTLAEFVDQCIPDQMMLDEMTSVASRDSGLKHHLWMSAKGNAKHDPRIKISNVVEKFDADDNFSLSVSDEPEIRAGTSKLKTDDLDNIKDWVRLNREHLIKSWNSDSMDSRDHLDGILKI